MPEKKLVNKWASFPPLPSEFAEHFSIWKNSILQVSCLETNKVRLSIDEKEKREDSITDKSFEMMSRTKKNNKKKSIWAHKEVYHYILYGLNKFSPTFCFLISCLNSCSWKKKETSEDWQSRKIYVQFNCCIPQFRRRQLWFSLFLIFTKPLL